MFPIVKSTRTGGKITDEMVKKAMFTIASGLTFVTFDAAFRRFKGRNLVLLD